MMTQADVLAESMKNRENSTVSAIYTKKNEEQRATINLNPEENRNYAYDQDDFVTPKEPEKPIQIDTMKPLEYFAPDRYR
jgi:hypothetical protein